jgi:DNA modification methylase
MKPYYQDEWVTIYHGDCRDILPTLERVDLVLTDPPYGIGKDGQKQSTGGHGGRKGYEFLGWDSNRPEKAVFDLMRAKSMTQIIWGGNYFADLLPPTGKWLVWDKGQRLHQSDGELAWTSLDGALRIYTVNRVELMIDKANHPTQKPNKLIARVIADYSESGQIILDPFLGSGTTAYCAKMLNRHCIGIEIEERYCEIAAKRCSQSVMNFNALTKQPD